MSKIISVVWKTSAALSLTTLFLIGCSSSTKNHQTNAATDVLAVVNDTTISRKEFEDQMRYLAQYRSSRLFTDEQKKNLLVDMVNFELILQRAVKENFPSEDEGIRRAIVQEYLKQRVNGQVAPSEDEILAAYKKSQLEYDKICARHILVNFEPRGEEAARKRAEYLISRLNSGEEFALLADLESDDPGTKGSGGDLDCFSRNKDFVPEFLDAAFKLSKPGEFTKKPVKTAYGYHIILLTRDLRSLKANHELIRNQFNTLKNRDLFTTFINKVRENAKVTMNFEKLTNINLSVIDATATPTSTPDSKP
jgi:parvulin-like peptidyl-prolyl isomerase